MDCTEVPATLSIVHASNGDPLLLIGRDESGCLMLWPTPLICQHKVAFARWCRRNVVRYRGNRVLLQHELNPRTRRWAQWLGVHFEAGQVII